MSTANPIRVVIVDDHGMVRRGLAAYLKNVSGLELIGEAQDGQEAVDMCARLHPDVILMDLVMPGLSGADAIHLIRKQCPQAQIIALTSFQEKDLVQAALRAGAISYLLKNVSGDELAKAIQAAHAGRPTLAPEAVQALVQPARPSSGAIQDLSERERQVLLLMSKGLSNPEIAEQLGISRSTIKVYVSNILSKLRASNRAEAVAIATLHGLLT